MIVHAESKLFKKTAVLILFVIIAFTSEGINVYASEEFDIQSQYEASGAGEVFGELPESVISGLDNAGIDTGNIYSAENFNSADVMNSLISMTGEEINAPIAALGIVIALLLFASVCRGGESALTSSMSPSLNAVISLSVGITLVVPVADLIDSANETTETACRFTESFGAAFAGIPVIRFFEKYAKWLLGFLAAIITTVLSISGIISASADSVGARTAKFIISGSVPVVGGAVSDAYLSIKSGMTMLRNSVGAFGIIATAYIFLPVIIRTFLWSFVAGIGEAVCDSMELSDLQKLMKSVSETLSLLIGVVVFSLFLLILGGILVMTIAK